MLTRFCPMGFTNECFLRGTLWTFKRRRSRWEIVIFRFVYFHIHTINLLREKVRDKLITLQAAKKIEKAILVNKNRNKISFAVVFGPLVLVFLLLQFFSRRKQSIFHAACLLRLGIFAKLLFVRYLLGCFVIIPINFLVTFAIFADFFRIFQAVSIKHVFNNIETKIYYHVFVTACNPCWICYSC